jgi:hypothetical protein
MMGEEAVTDQVKETLERALALSHEVAAAADRGDGNAVVALDRERRKLLESFGNSGHSLDGDAWHLMQEVVALNNRSIGAMEHRRRITQRQLDGVLTGRRAINAYGVTRQSR